MPDQEMIDKVAEGLRQHFKDTVAKSADMPFEETKVTIPAKVIWEDYAKAAIKAMREPTEKMINAKDKNGDEIHWGYSCHTCGGIKDAYYAMIDSITENLCEDEGCPNSNISHICINKND